MFVCLIQKKKKKKSSSKRERVEELNGGGMGIKEVREGRKGVKGWSCERSIKATAFQGQQKE